MKKGIRTWALALIVVAFAAASISDSVTATENPCKADIKRLCGDVKPGKGRIQACLKAHEDEISQECRESIAAAVEKLKGKLEVVMEACKGDAATLCKNVEPGEGRIFKCLMEHKEQLSEGCKNSIGK